MADQREQEMAALRARYAALRGKKVEEEPKKTEVVKESPKKPTKKSNPYIVLIKDDISRIPRFFKKLMGLKSDKSVFDEMVEDHTKKSLNLSWLKKKGGFK